MAKDRAKFRNQIIGLMRFSYPSKGGFAKDEPDMDALEAHLFDEARLARRFDLFENLTLPALLAQSDQDFRMVFLIGRNMPQAWTDRLSDLVAPLKGARIVAFQPMQHYLAIRKAYALATPDAATHVTGFRLDDDDAMDLDHIARMRRTVEALLPAAGPEVPLVTGCNRGFFLERKATGNEIYEVVEKTPIGLGLAMTTPKGVSENIFRRNHRFCGQFYNTFTEANTPAFIRTVHADNDSDPHASGRIEKSAWEDVAPLLESHFPFTADFLKGF
ncbi:glycosyltransferase [Gemmobacter serpentinus]|uniref:glycosyltransferase n=1 Tax=Gemmobacter serpentinus TaxID=2652247 RepID=UPI00124DFC97|nr:glycosyltransferase [Gemmobacter serpentinus]